MADDLATIGTHCIDLSLLWVAIPYGAVSILILLVNVLMIVIILSSPALRTPTGCIMVSLSVADIMTGVLESVLTVVFKVQDGCIPHATCALLGYPACVSASVSMFSHFLLSLDRHESILNPYSYSLRVTVTRTVVVIVSVWVSMIVVLLPAGLGVFGKIRFYPQVIACYLDFVDDVVPLSVYVPVVTGMPLIGMFVCYFRIWRVSRRHRRQIAAQTVSVQCSGEDNRTTRPRVVAPGKDKALKTVVLIMACFYLSWIPFLTGNILTGAFGVHPPLWLDVVLFIILISNSIMNSVIYYVTFRTFREEAKRILRMRCRTTVQFLARSEQ